MSLLHETEANEASEEISFKSNVWMLLTVGRHHYCVKEFYLQSC